ncbi:PulJ/GspJ family protein [Leptolyngbya iicbica]|uniref:Type II secretion system protein n=3 Tax=Cyanophyceae TaxID=3028117 RepID=A0A4Q7E374_9CYAN|nr:hypothetical protein DYY88_18940 [Leptolyngbya sp. LK]
MPLNGLTANQASVAGLTLLECLAAIVVVGMIGAAITPVLVLSVATRVQSQKAEQALAVAQGEIDRVRVILEQGGDRADALRDLDPAATSPPPANPLPTAAGSTITEVPAPTAPAVPILPADVSADFDQPTQTIAVFVDPTDDPTDPDDADFAVQRFRVEAPDVERGFYIGVRVYDYQAIVDGDNLGINEGSLGLTSSQGERVRAPMAALYSTAFVTAEGTAFCNYIDFDDAAGGTTTADDDKPLGCE